MIHMKIVRTFIAIIAVAFSVPGLAKARLTDAQVDLLKRWIDADLPWEDGFAFGKATRQAPLVPRRPKIPDVPATARLSNPIDRFLHAYFAERKIPAGPIVSPEDFGRRASFDLIGLPPTTKDIDGLQSDSQAS